MADYKKDDSVGEEVSAFGQRVKGAAKDAVGSVTGDTSLEREGERENAMGNARQESNSVFDESDGVRGSSAGSAAGAAASTSSGRGRMVTGLFKDRESAESAYNSFSTRGYGKDDVNLMMSDEARKKHFADSPDSALGDKALEGAGVGSAVGGTVGAVLAAIAAIGTSIVLPGIGLVVAGPIAAALAGAGAGGLTGGLIGALVGSGIPEDRAREYEQGIKEGGMVMGINARSDEDADYLEKEFRNNRGENVYR
ncbi:MAG: CsbD family protein [Pyrinomonadaceae bacterium]